MDPRDILGSQFRIDVEQHRDVFAALERAEGYGGMSIERGKIIVFIQREDLRSQFETILLGSDIPYNIITDDEG